MSHLRVTSSLKEDLSQAVIMMEAPGDEAGGGRGSPDHHSGEDNEETVLPLPHKAAIAVSFQKPPLVTKEPFRRPSLATPACK